MITEQTGKKTSESREGEGKAAGADVGEVGRGNTLGEMDHLLNYTEYEE